MNVLLSICGALMLSCCGIHGGLMRDLQHEIDAIKIALTDNVYSLEERQFLIGKSEGIFLAMEIIDAQGIW